MSQGKVDLVAIFPPKPGKADRVAEVLLELGKHVEANEPGVGKYQIFKEVNKETGTEDIVIVETYDSWDVHVAHKDTPQFAKLLKTLEEEDLINGEFTLKYLTQVGGFASRK